MEYIAVIIAIIIILVLLWISKDYFINKTPQRPPNPKLYNDISEDHPDVQNFYKESEKYAKSTKKYTKLGYKKIKMPNEVFDYLKTTTSLPRIAEHPSNLFPRSHGGSPPYIINIPENKKKWIESKLKPILEEWVGFPLKHTATYGPREYVKTSSLRNHVDRETHIVSCILNIGQSGCTKDWPLQVKGHDQITRDIFMKPGDMVLYESRTVMHGRPEPCSCDSYINMFVHFYPDDSVGGLQSTFIKD